MRADLVLLGGMVITLDPNLPAARGVAIADGRIVAVGDEAALEPLCDHATTRVDLRGRAVLPGFVDAHVHFGSFALARQQVNLDGAATLDDGLDMIREFARRLGPGAWVRGRGWDRNRWGRVPTAADLGRATDKRPAALSSHDGHSLWLNAAAMAATGLTRVTKAPPGGVIERDTDGQPSGVLFENAQDLVRRHIPEPDAVELARAIRQALPIAAAAGLTGIHNLEDERSLAAFRSLEESGDLTLRVYHGVRRGQLRKASDLGLRTGAGSDRVRIGPVKLFSDGALGSRTAYLLEPYEGAGDGYCGVPTLTGDEIIADMLAAGEAGLDVAVHAIGDAAVRTVLDSIEAARRHQPSFGDRMVRVEHAQLVHPDDVPRFARLGVVASMQPIHAIADWRAADAHWGARARHGYAWRSLLDAGAAVAFGTDAPVENIAPLASLVAATTRRDPNGEPNGGWYPEQRMSLVEAVRAYTSGSASAERALDRRGSIRAGYDADLVVVAPDPFRDGAALEETRVEMTLVGGKQVFGA